MRTWRILLACFGALAALPACVAHLEAGWLPVEVLDPSGRVSSPDAPAVVLERKRHYRLFRGPKGEIGQLRVHEVKLVQSEAGLDLADVQISIPPEARLLELRARARLPDGTIAEVDASQMLEQTATGEQARAESLRVFRFPDVRVGSVLEYVYTVEYPWLMRTLESAVSDRLPVERFELTVDCHADLLCGMTLYGSDVQPTLAPAPNGGWRLRWSGEGFRGMPPEPMAPDWRWDHVWWAVRVREQWSATRQLPSDFEGELEWAIAVGSPARYFRDGTWGDGFELPSPRVDEGCADDACRVDRAAAWVRRNVQQSELGGHLRASPLREILAREKGTSTERTLVLDKLLRMLGVESRLAATGRGFLDRDFPSRDRLDHLMVFLPEVGGPQGTYVDLSCEACRPGELPPWSRDVEVLHFWTVGGSPYPKVVARWERSHGLEYPHLDVLRTTSRVTLDGKDGVDLALSLAWGGRHYDRLSRFHDSARRPELQERRGDLVQQVRATARPASHTDVACSSETRTCTEALTVGIPAQVREAGGLRLVAVPFFPVHFDEDLEPGPRERGVRRMDESLRQDVVHVELPEGWEPASLPPPVKATCPQAEVTTGATRDGRTVTLSRTVRLLRSEGSEEDWPRLRETLRQFRDAGRAVLVLRPVVPPKGEGIPASPLGQAQP